MCFNGSGISHLVPIVNNSLVDSSGRRGSAFSPPFPPPPYLLDEWAVSMDGGRSGDDALSAWAGIRLQKTLRKSESVYVRVTNQFGL